MLHLTSESTRGIWQRRYWEHLIRDQADFNAHVDYIHFNPVKHGLVDRVRDWRHSSFHAFVREGLLPVDWGGDQRDGPDGVIHDGVWGNV